MEDQRRSIATTPSKICGVDPGVRKMLAVFDETDKTVHYYGQDGPVRTKLRKLRDRAQTLSDQAATKAKNQQQQAARDYSRGCKKPWTKIDGIRQSLHQAIVRDLVSNYALISLDHLKNKSIASNTNGVLKSSVKNDLHLWSHYAFRKRLEERCLGTPTVFVLQDESYTSKTFNCKNCGYNTDRDVNGARNILQKNIKLVLTENKITAVSLGLPAVTIGLSVCYARYRDGYDWLLKGY